MPAKKHNFTVTEIKAGALVLAGAAVVALFIAVISGLRPPERTLALSASFTDTGGLNKGADVRFGGAKVGRVTAIELDPDDQSRVRVEARVKEGTPVNAASEAFITQTTLTSEKHLEITTGSKDAPLVASGAVIPTGAGGLFDQAGQVARSVTDILQDVKDLVGVEEAKQKETAGEEEMVTITALIRSVDKTLNEGDKLVADIRDVVSDKKGDISDILKKVKEVEDAARKLVEDLNATVAENREPLKGAVAGVRDAVAGAQPIVERVAALSDRLDEIAGALQSVLTRADAAAREAGGLVADNRPVLEDLILDLRETVRYLKSFARTMAEQPEAVIRGKGLEGRR